MQDLLIEYDRPTEVVTDDFKEYLKLLNGDIQQLGSGYYAVVYEKPDNPENTVTKVGKFDLKKDYDGEYSDSYVNFIMELQKNPRAADNPFFPQVYQIKFYNQKDQLMKYSAELEKLKPFDEDKYYDTDSVEKAMNHLENEPQSSFTEVIRALKRIAKFNTEEFFSETLDAFGEIGISSVLTHFLTNFVQYRVYPPKTPQAADAVKIIHQLPGNFDLHSRNVMYRRSPYGLQLVFTDPLA